MARLVSRNACCVIGPVFAAGAILGVTLLLVALDLAAASDETAEHVDFNFQIRPLLSDRCFKCHGPDPKSRKAKLRLDLSEGA